MNSRTLRTVITSLVCLALLTPFSSSSAQTPSSLAPPIEPRSTSLQTVSTQTNSPTQSLSQPIPRSANLTSPTDGLRVRLAVAEFDPLVTAEPAGLPSDLRLSSYPGDGTGYYLVQFDGPISSSDIDGLVAAGAQVHD